MATALVDLYDGEDFFVMIINGPNSRNDFHVTNSEEFFYQLKGDIVVRILENGKMKDVSGRYALDFADRHGESTRHVRLPSRGKEFRGRITSRFTSRPSPGGQWRSCQRPFNPP